MIAGTLKRDGRGVSIGRPNKGKALTETIFGRQVEIFWPDLGITVTAELDGRNPGLADVL